jgi:hypothetical protein
MQKVNLFKRVLYCVMYLMLCSASIASTLLDQAIDSAKSRRAAELLGQSPSAPAPRSPISNAQPQLWALSGINNSLTAEVLYQGQVTRVPLKKGARVHAWRVTDFDDQGISFGGKSSAKRYLPAAQKGSTGQAFLLGMDASQAGTNGNAQSAAANLPLPPPPYLQRGERP